MDKEAFRSMAGKLRHAKRVAQVFVAKNPEVTGAGVGSVATGALSGFGQKAINERVRKKGTKKEKELLKKHKVFYHPVTQGVIGAVSGGIAGGQVGSAIGGTKNWVRQTRKAYRKAYGKDWKNRARQDFGGRGYGGEAGSARVRDLGVPSWLSGVKTKKDAKSAFRAAARKHHPDLGGDPEKMKKLNQEWESFQKHHFDKLSMMIPGLFSELAEIYR